MYAVRPFRWIALGAGMTVTVALACSSDGGTDPNGDDTTPAAITVVAGNGQSGTAGGTLGDPLVVEVTNAAGDPLSGLTVEWSVQSGGGTLSTTSTTTSAQGRAQVTFTLGQVGPNVVRAALATIALSTTFTLTATQAPTDNTPAAIEISSGNNQSAIVGGSLPAPLAVVVRNAASEALSGITVTWTVTQGGGSVGSATSTTNAQGIASTTYTVGGSAGSEQIEAAVQSDASLTQTFTATANAPPSAAGVSVEDPASFDPSDVIIAESGTVTWTWNGAVQHNVTWVSGGFMDSPTQASGTHQVTFPSTGTFGYYCTIHGTPTTGMRGTVDVR
jgi:plastocyanin